MVSTHERLASQSTLQPELSACLADEKRRRDTLGRDLRNRLLQATQTGQLLFRGVAEDASAHGDTAPEIVKSVLDRHILDFFEKLELGARPIAPDDPERILTSSNLNGLPAIFYEGEHGLGLVTKQADKYVANAAAEVAKEVINHVKQRSDYGEKVTGKSIETHFRGFGYGRERDILRLVLATLLRAGAIEVTSQGRRFRNHADPMARQAFTSNNAFRAAAFAPREALDLKMLTEAAKNYEEITGEEVDIEETAISQAFQRLAREDREVVSPLLARVSALNLPGADFLGGHLRWLEGVGEYAPDDCVRALATEGKTFKEARQRVAKTSDAVTETNVATLEAARLTVRQRVPVLAAQWVEGEPLQEVATRLAANLEADTFYERLAQVGQDNKTLKASYATRYNDVHGMRAEVYEAAIESIKGIPDWPTVPKEAQQAILAPLTTRFCAELDLPAKGSVVCAKCRASVGQMESDIAAADGLKRAAVKRLDEELAPQGERVERVRVSDFFPESLATPEDVEERLTRLRERILQLIAEGARVVLE